MDSASLRHVMLALQPPVVCPHSAPLRVSAAAAGGGRQPAGASCLGRFSWGLGMMSSFALIGLLLLGGAGPALGIDNHHLLDGALLLLLGAVILRR